MAQLKKTAGTLAMAFYEFEGARGDFFVPGLWKNTRKLLIPKMNHGH